MAVNLPYRVARKFPKLKEQLKIAYIKQTPEKFIRKSLVLSFYFAIAISVFLFFILTTFGIGIMVVFFALPVVFFMAFWFFVNSPKVAIRKRQREINKEVLFAGRFLLIKLESGTPLFNALTDASNSEGFLSKYFKEIVDDISTGMTIEKALEKARDCSPSEKFKMIITELTTTLNTGADVTSPLKNVLQQIMKEQMLEIKEYSKKLNSLLMLYLVLAIVVPSLGLTLFAIVAGFLALEISNSFLFAMLLILGFFQFMFISIFKAQRPMVEL